jgi:CDP-paratose 2-epimerase
MKILITGVCGFVGSTLARTLLDTVKNIQIFGLDNFIRPGSESNRDNLKQLGVKIFHGDIRNASDLETLPAVDYVVDAAANPSVLAGSDGKSSSRQVVEHNLIGTLNMLEFCKQHKAGFVLLSTSRVYSIPPLANLKVVAINDAYQIAPNEKLPAGLTSAGLAETFSTTAPVSLYGATKLTSEALALEYGENFNFPVFINRCGVLAGAGQFGRPDQGIFAYWINSWKQKQPLKYIGFDGQGHQVRDCLHPRDLVPLLQRQFLAAKCPVDHRIINCSGGAPSTYSLRQLSGWCEQRFGPHVVASDPNPRAFDIPWMVLDSTKAKEIWNWQPQMGTGDILAEIASHADKNPDWLNLSAPL